MIKSLKKSRKDKDNVDKNTLSETFQEEGLLCSKAMFSDKADYSSLQRYAEDIIRK